MSHTLWQSLLLEPEPLNYPTWFTTIARRLLCGTTLMVSGIAHRLTEIEFYYYGAYHKDVFAHRDPIQVTFGRWYFHRTNGIYRGGSFKGVDITFGGMEAYGGILLRGIEQEGGTLIDGPSLTVEHLLKLTEIPSVAQLDQGIAGRDVWDTKSPVHLVWQKEVVDRAILTSARVGLSLRRVMAPWFLLPRYRYLTEPKRIKKGKLHMALARYADGASASEILAQIEGAKGAIDRYIADYEVGLTETSFDPYFGLELGPKELARLHGLWYKMYAE